jgi:hypothetical protein
MSSEYLFLFITEQTVEQAVSCEETWVYRKYELLIFTTGFESEQIHTELGELVLESLRVILRFREPASHS